MLEALFILAWGVTLAIYFREAVKMRCAVKTLRETNEKLIATTFEEIRNHRAVAEDVIKTAFKEMQAQRDAFEEMVDAIAVTLNKAMAQRQSFVSSALVNADTDNEVVMGDPSMPVFFAEDVQMCAGELDGVKIKMTLHAPREDSESTVDRMCFHGPSGAVFYRPSQKDVTKWIPDEWSEEDEEKFFGSTPEDDPKPTPPPET